MLTTPPREKNIVKYSQGVMLPLETKQSGGKLLPHSDLRGRGGYFKGSITQQEKGLFLGTWNVSNLYRAGRRWEDNIKMDLREVGGVGDWMELAQDRDRWRALVSTVMNFRVP